MSTRPYLVFNEVTNTSRLVEANSQAAALSFVVKQEYSVSTPNASKVAQLMSAGVKLETATKEVE